MNSMTKEPDIKHALIRYRTKALEIQYKLDLLEYDKDKLKAEQLDTLEGMNTLLPEKYKVRQVSLKKLERSIGRWSKDNV